MASLVLALLVALSVISAVTVQGSLLERSELSGRLVGGEEAAAGEFPWQVSLRKLNKHLCGGSLVTRQHVLIAAHCLISQVASTFTVITGTSSLAKGGETHAVSRIEYHTNYTGRINSYQFDVGVVTLAAEITVTNLQRPIALATEDPPVGAEVIVSGWGKILYPSSSNPTALQKLKLRVLNITECQSYWNLEIYDSQLCAMKEYGAGVCNGDSGGPLVYNNEIVGIVSWGRACARGIPDVYTRVYSYLDWISDVLYATETFSGLENTLEINNDDI